MKENKGIGISAVLTLILAVLKLTGLIEWPWAVVLLGPALLTTVFGLTLLLLAVVIKGIIDVMERMQNK